jgi:uncharacterized protein with HEPN domain
LSAIDAVEETLRGISEGALADDRRRRLALERLFEIISVASDHIPASLKAVENSVDWQTISDMVFASSDTRNRIETRVLWVISEETLIPLKACAERRIREPNRQ